MREERVQAVRISAKIRHRGAGMNIRVSLARSGEGGAAPLEIDPIFASSADSVSGRQEKNRSTDRGRGPGRQMRTLRIPVE